MNINQFVIFSFLSFYVSSDLLVGQSFKQHIPDNVKSKILYESSAANLENTPADSFVSTVDSAAIHTTRDYIHPITVNLDTNLILPPAWAFGVLFGGYTNQNETIERVNNIIDHNYPIDAYWIDSWFWSFAEKGRGPNKYIDFIADTISFPNRYAMWNTLEKNNVKAGFWIWDCIMKTGNENIFTDFESKGYFKNIYIEKGSWHNYSTTTAMHEKGENAIGTLCGNIDFENPDAVNYFKEKVKPFFDEGADFLKLDRTSAIPVCKTMFEITQEFGKETEGRGFILSHTGGMESDKYKRYPAKWTDDTRSDWTIEKPTKKFNSWVPNVAFKENIAMFTDPNKETSKIPFLTNDLGGFDFGLTKAADEELYIRWLQFSFFTPIVEVFSQPENPTSNLPYLYSLRADTLFRFYSHLRMELFPYIYSYAHHRRLAGKQMIQPIPNNLDEYMFGKELLIAPVYEQGARKRNVFLPSGKWYDFWTDEIYQGDAYYSVSAPVETIPIFVRSGSIIPMRNYNRAIEIGSNDSLTIHLYLGQDFDFMLIEDDGKSNDYLKGIYAVTHFNLNNAEKGYKFSISPVLGFYRRMSSERWWKISIHSDKKIEKIMLNGTEVSFIKDEQVYHLDYFKSHRHVGNLIEIYSTK